MTDYDIHTCSYYCDRPACVLRQRDELRDKLFVEFEKNIQTSDTQSLWRKRQNNSDVNRSQGRIRVINEPTKNITNESQFFEWWNGDELVEGTSYQKGTPLYWAMQGWQAANKQPFVKTYSGGNPNYTQPIEPEPMIDGWPLYSGLPLAKVQDERETQHKSWAKSAQVIAGQYDPRREWVGLTDDDRDEIRELAYYEFDDISNAIEAKLKEKNSG